MIRVLLFVIILVCNGFIGRAQSELKVEELESFKEVARQQYTYFQNFYSVILHPTSSPKDIQYAAILAKKQFHSSSNIKDILGGKRTSDKVNEYYDKIVKKVYSTPYLNKKRQLVEDSISLKSRSTNLNGNLQKFYFGDLVYWEEQEIGTANGTKTKSYIEEVYKSIDFRIANISNSDNGYQLLFSAVDIFDKSNIDAFKKYSKSQKDSNYDVISDQLPPPEIDVTGVVNKDSELESLLLDTQPISYGTDFKPAKLEDYLLPGLYFQRNKRYVIGSSYNVALIAGIGLSLHHKIKRNTWYNRAKNERFSQVLIDEYQAQGHFHNKRLNQSLLLTGALYFVNALHTSSDNKRAKRIFKKDIGFNLTPNLNSINLAFTF